MADFVYSMATVEEARAIGKREERALLRPLLEECENLAEGVRFNHPDEWERDNLAPLLARIRRELGKEP